MRRLFLASKAPRLVIDPADSELTDVPGAVTFRDVGRATNAKGENWRTAATARFVPRDPYDMDEYDAVYHWAFMHFPRRVWTDEAGIPMPSNGGSGRAKTLQTQGRKRQCGHLACHPRPVGCSRELIAQSEHVFVFYTPSVIDRRYLADTMGVDRAVFEQLHAELDEHGFLHQDQRAGTFVRCMPLTA